MSPDHFTAYQLGFRDGLQGRKPTSDDSLYMMGFDDGKDEDIRWEMERDRYNGEEL